MRKFFTSIYFIGLITLIGFPLLAWLVHFLGNTSFIESLKINLSELLTVPFFLGFGIAFGLLVIFLSELPYFEKPLSGYRNLLSNLKLTIFHAFFLSVCAGVGEEIFFRGAVQPWLGIWITAVFFVAIHGYFSWKNKAINVFAIALTLFIVVIGWAAEKYTLWHAIAAHFSYDFVLLMYHRKTSQYSS